MFPELFINLLAASIGGFAVFSWRSHIYPAIIEGFFEPTKLANEYRGVLDFGHGPNHEVSLQVRKRGYQVVGVLTFLRGRHKGKVYPVKGRYSHSLLTFHYFPVDKISTSQGTASFQRLHDGDLFVGYFAYFSQEEDRVSTVRCELRPTTI
jgi:hypothetical protein